MEGLFNPLSILLHTINALILFVALYFLLYKPVRKFLRAREERIGARLDEAANAEQNADATRETIAQQKLGAAHEVAGILADGQQKLKIQQDQMLAAARAEAEEILKSARLEADALLSGAHDAMQAQAASLALDIARAVLAREVRPEDNARLIDDFLKKVS